MPRRWSVVAVLTLLLAGCISTLLYSGDGRLIDHGSFAAVERYVVDLGPIDLRKVNDRTYQVGHLPNERFHVGIDVIFETPRAPVTKPLNAIIAVELHAQDGTKLFSEEKPLGEWQWAEWRDEPQTPFLWQGHATFDPRSGERYRLQVRVVEPDTSAERYRATLVVKGGGWKAELPNPAVNADAPSAAPRAGRGSPVTLVR